MSTPGRAEAPVAPAADWLMSPVGCPGNGRGGICKLDGKPGADEKPGKGKNGKGTEKKI